MASMISSRPMARPLGIEYEGVVYHITSRGDRREPMALDDVDQSAFMEVLARDHYQRARNLSVATRCSGPAKQMAMGA